MQHRKFKTFALLAGWLATAWVDTGWFLPTEISWKPEYNIRIGSQLDFEKRIVRNGGEKPWRHFAGVG